MREKLISRAFSKPAKIYSQLPRSLTVPLNSPRNVLFSPYSNLFRCSEIVFPCPAIYLFAIEMDTNSIRAEHRSKKGQEGNCGGETGSRSFVEKFDVYGIK